MKSIKLKQTDKPDIEISKQDFLINVVEFLRRDFPKEECVIYEKKINGRTTEEGPVAVLSLIRNPQMVIHYNTIIKHKKQ